MNSENLLKKLRRFVQHCTESKYDQWYERFFTGITPNEAIKIRGPPHNRNPRKLAPSCLVVIIQFLKEEKNYGIHHRERQAA